MDTLAKIRILNLISGHTRQTKIRNKFIREKVNIVLMVENMIESHLRCKGL